jgi:hypothetical protein
VNASIPKSEAGKYLRARNVLPPHQDVTALGLTCCWDFLFAFPVEQIALLCVY